MLHTHPSHVFALAIFLAVGVSHTLHPRVWKEYVSYLASRGGAGVAIYASFHALPGAILLAQAGTGHWTSIVLTIAGGGLLTKAAVYPLFEEFAAGRMRQGVTLPDAAWSAAGAIFLALAAVAGWGAFVASS